MVLRKEGPKSPEPLLVSLSERIMCEEFDFFHEHTIEQLFWNFSTV